MSRFPVDAQTERANRVTEDESAPVGVEPAPKPAAIERARHGEKSSASHNHGNIHGLVRRQSKCRSRCQHRKEIGSIHSRFVYTPSKIVLHFLPPVREAIHV